MVTEIKVDVLSDDNKRSGFKSKKIKVGGKDLVTPSKVLDPSKLNSEVNIDKSIFGFNEIYRVLKSDKIKKLQTDSNEHDYFDRNLASVSRRGADALNVCMVKFIPKEKGRLPEIKEIEFLADVAHSYSDIVPIPAVDFQIYSNNFSSYIDYVRKSFLIINEANNKPIMGSLPDMPRDLYPKLIDYYLRKDIKSFYFDFNGRTPSALKMRPIIRYLGERKVLSQSLIYSINSKIGRPLKNADVIPAKDFISFGYGIDVIGESHTSPKKPKEFYEKMKKAVDKQQENKKRIFIKSDYGYHKVDSKEISDVYPRDTNVKLQKILSDDQKFWQKIFNMEQQAIEANTIKKRLSELGPRDSILDYIGKKSMIQGELKNLRSVAFGRSLIKLISLSAFTKNKK